jgi:hypothetical protein
MVVVKWSAEKKEIDTSKGKMENWSRVTDTPYFYEWSHDNLDVSVAVVEDDWDEEKYETIVLVDGVEERDLHLAAFREEWSTYNKQDVKTAAVQWLKSHPLNMDEMGVWYRLDMSGKTSNLATWKNPITGTKVRYKDGYSSTVFFVDSSVGEPGGLMDPEIEGFEAKDKENRYEWMRNHTYR